MATRKKYQFRDNNLGYKTNRMNQNYESPQIHNISQLRASEVHHRSTISGENNFKSPESQKKLYNTNGSNNTNFNTSESKSMNLNSERPKYKPFRNFKKDISDTTDSNMAQKFLNKKGESTNIDNSFTGHKSDHVLQKYQRPFPSTITKSNLKSVNKSV